MDDPATKARDKPGIEKTLQAIHVQENKYLDELLDVRDRVLNQFDINDPSALSTRFVEGAKNVTTLAYGGAFVLSAMPDAARPLMSYGFRNFMQAIPAVARNLDNFAFINKEMREVAGGAQEFSNATTMARFVEQGELAGFGRRRMGERLLQRAQGPFFLANVLGPWTHWWKGFSGYMAQHLMLKYSDELLRGTIKKRGLVTLSSMGIDKNIASRIMSQPIQRPSQTDGKTWFLNSSEWTDPVLRRRIAAAIVSETERVIVQPNIGDKPNIMSGIFRVSDKTATAVRQSTILKNAGFNVVGNKVSHPAAALPFQFLSWPVSATTKVMGEALQRRDASVFMGMMMMISMGYFSGYLKHYNWSDLSAGEQAIRSVELAGIGGVFTDIPLMVEELSYGNWGMRALLGYDPLYSRDTGDIVGRVGGAAPSYAMEIIKAFADPELRADQRSAIVRRSFPFASLFWLKDMSRWMEKNTVLPAIEYAGDSQSNGLSGIL